jgi:hypothetical protein
MDQIDQHRTFLFMDELEGGVRNPPTQCRKTAIVDPTDMLVTFNDDGTINSGLNLGLYGDATQESERSTQRQPGIVQIGRSPQVDMGYDGSAGVSQSFKAMKYPDFSTHQMITWPGQNFEHFSTMWEGMHCPLVNFNERGKGLTPVVDDCGLLIGYFQQAVSTSLLFMTEDGEIFYSNQYGSHTLGMKPIGGHDLWLSAAGKVLVWSQKHQNQSAWDRSQMYHQKIPGANKADILVDIDGYVMAINTYLSPPPQPEPGFWDTPVGMFLGFMLPSVPPAECMPGGRLEGDPVCALEMAMMQVDFVFLFFDIMSLGSTKILRKAAMKLLTAGVKSRRAAKLLKGAGQTALKGGRVSERAGQLLLSAPSIRRPQLALPAPSKAGKKAKELLAAEKSGKKSNFMEVDLGPKTGMTHMAIRDVRAKMIKLGVRVRFRPAGTARKLRKRGAIPKWEELKMKTISDDDILLGAPKSGKTKPGYFDPKLPDPKLEKSNKELYDRLMKRYKQRKEEFKELAEKVKKYEKDGDIIVEDGVVKDGPTGKDIAGDYDIYEILDKNGKRITDADPRYNKIIDDLRGRRIGAQHGAHVEWKPKDPFEKKIYDEIIERHRSKEPLYEFREDGSVWETFAD